MRHLNRSSRLGVKTGHRTAMLRNLALGLIEHGRIRTTVARARRLRPFIEKLVTRLKDPTVHNLRMANSELSNRGAVMSLARNIAPKFKDRPGGYLRILKLARPRPGDCADMAFIEWVDESLVGAYQEDTKASAAKGKKAQSAKTSKTAKSAKKDSAEDSTDDAKAKKKKSSKASSGEA